MTQHAERQEPGQARPSRDAPAQAARIGWLVFVALITLVLMEYVIFLLVSVNLPIMIVMNLIDAALIMYYFMHVSRIWRGEHGEKEDGA